MAYNDLKVYNCNFRKYSKISMRKYSICIVLLMDSNGFNRTANNILLQHFAFTFF